MHDRTVTNILIYSSNRDNILRIKYYFDSYNIRLNSFQVMEDAIHHLYHELPDFITIDLTTDNYADIDVALKLQFVLHEQDSFLPILLLIKTSQFELIDSKPTSPEGEKLHQALKTLPFHIVPDDYACWTHTDWQAFYLRMCGLYSIYQNCYCLKEELHNLQHLYRSMRREMTDVWNIQRSFLSRHIFDNSTFSVATSYKPSAQVGGDYYDIIEIDQDHVALVMADIAGHGASAAVIMAITQMTIKEFGRGITQPGKALDVFNKKLNDHLSSHHFVTMFYAILNTKTLHLIYTSAGHNPPLHYVRNTQKVCLLESEPAFPLRTFDNLTYDVRQVKLNQGDRLLLFTDGVTDIQNDQNELFGVDKLKTILLNHHKEEINKVVEIINQETDSFLDQRVRLDDFTIMLVQIS